jgi:hypothetical protein
MLHLLVDWEYPHWMMMGIHPNRTAKGYAGIRIG